MFIVVCYDIVDDRRRGKACKLLQGYGAHVQESVFECDLTLKQYQRLRANLDKMVDPTEDKVRFYNLCQNCIGRVEIVGSGSLESSPDYFVV